MEGSEPSPSTRPRRCSPTYGIPVTRDVLCTIAGRGGPGGQGAGLAAPVW